MRRTRQTIVKAVPVALVALVASGLAVLAMTQPAAALPSGCTHVYIGPTINGNWDFPGNWSPAAVPDSSTAVACIPGGNHVVRPNAGLFSVTVNQLHIDAGSVVDIWAGGTIFFDGQTTPARLGGPGMLVVSGYADLGGAGRLVTNAVMSITNGGNTLLDSDSFLSADWGTSTVINPGGELQLDGSGGYYQGNAVSGQPLGKLTNNGTLIKSQGSSTSIVEADYVQGATGQVQVDCCAVLSFAGHHQFSGQVQAGMGLGTGACGAGTFTICHGSVNPAIDVMSMQLQIPSSNSEVYALVQLEELTQPPPLVDSRAIGNEVYAHAEQLDVDPANPATLTLRFSQADVMATPLAEIQVGHISDVTGVMTKTPDCISGTLPPGASFCINRQAVFRTTENTFVTVLTTQTSRWRVRRTAPGESFDQTAPDAPQGLATKLSPKDGSGVALSWTPPANDGGAAPTAYRVYRDGKLLTAVGGTSLAVKNSGPGEHVFMVTAVNVIGEGAAGTTKVKLDKLSKPRKVTALRGAAGGKLTAGAKWKPPADAGGYTITKYKVGVFKKNGKKVDIKVVKASKLKYLFKLAPARYFVRVKARNTDRWGPWSKPTDLVRPR